jgi:arginine-tRNA-protein transferase
MAHRKDWKEKSINPYDYYQTFVDGNQEFAHELLYLKDGRLLGVALIDILPQAISAVYCYYDPEERQRGLGVFSVLQHIEIARTRGIPWMYMGYWVEGNASMRYKASYQPHEILAGRPEFSEEPDWRP